MSINVIAEVGVVKFKKQKIRKRQFQKFLHSIEHDPSIVRVRKVIREGNKKRGLTQQMRYTGFRYRETTTTRNPELETEFEGYAPNDEVQM